MADNPLALWVQQPADEKLRKAIRDAFGPDLPPGKIRDRMPDKWTPQDGPVVIVTSDGTTRAGNPTRELVRVLVRASSALWARKLLSLIDGYLMSPYVLIGIPRRPATGLIVGPDSRVGGFYASTTYAVDLPRKKV